MINEKKIIGVIGARIRDSEEDFKEVEKIFLRYYSEGDIICSGLCLKAVIDSPFYYKRNII